MRVTGGQYRGRMLNVPKGRDIRPTSDKVRQAVFNSLRSYDLPYEAKILDIFCGSGALGIEALSRGAVRAVFVDKSAESIAACRKNVQALNLDDKAVFLKRDMTRPGIRPEAVLPADLVFCDPPYRQDLVVPALTALADGHWIADYAICVIECEKDLDFTPPENFVIFNEKTYGDTRVLYLRYEMTPLK